MLLCAAFGHLSPSISCREAGQTHKQCISITKEHRAWAASTEEKTVTTGGSPGIVLLGTGEVMKQDSMVCDRSRTQSLLSTPDGQLLTSIEFGSRSIKRRML